MSGWSCRHGEQGAHPATGRFVYSDGSGHLCCELHTRQLRGLPHGPGRFVALSSEYRLLEVA